MIGISRRDPDVVGRTVAEAKLDWLGRGPDGNDYGTFRSQEFAVEPHPCNPEDYSRRRDELYVMRIKREVIDGSAFEHHATHRALPVPNGTYAALLAKATKPAAEKPIRTWGVLAALPVMQRREPVRAAAGMSTSVLDTLEHLPATTEQEKEVIAGAVDLLDRNRPAGIIEVGGNQPPHRSPAGIIAYLSGHGVELMLARGRLLARSRAPIRSNDRALIDKARELIVGHLRGSPVMCSTCAEPAVDIAYPDAPMCAKHLEG